MNAILQSQIFFFISSIGFIFLWMLIAVFLFYLVKSIKILSRIMEKIEKDVNHISDSTKELIEEVRDSIIFNFLFKKKRKTRKD